QRSKPNPRSKSRSRSSRNPKRSSSNSAPTPPRLRSPPTRTRRSKKSSKNSPRYSTRARHCFSARSGTSSFPTECRPAHARGVKRDDHRDPGEDEQADAQPEHAGAQTDDRRPRNHAHVTGG